MSAIPMWVLLRAYPRAWRERYGDELSELIEQTSGGGRPSWRVSANVLLAGGRERLRAGGVAGDGLTPEDRATSGCLLVLWAWVLFVVGGAVVQKTAEHWQAATPPSSQALPAAAFQALLVAAILGGVLVLVGIGLTYSRLRTFLGTGGWPSIRRPMLRAASLTVVTVAATIVLSLWAHRITGAQRNGLDRAYVGAFAVWAVLALTCLVAWTTVAVATARRIGFTRRLLLAETWLATAVSAMMAVMMIATVTWWGAIAQAAPWFLAGTTPGTAGSAFSAQLATATALMVIATSLAATGTARALRNLRVHRAGT